MSHAWEKIEALSFWRAEVGFDVVKQLWMGIPLLYLFYAYEDVKYVPLASGPEIEGFKYYCSLCVLKKFLLYFNMLLTEIESRPFFSLLPVPSPSQLLSFQPFPCSPTLKLIC